MLKKILLALLLVQGITSRADMPGKKAMSESRITIINLVNITGYGFYWLQENDSARIINNDTIRSIPGSGGAPLEASLWAVNHKTKISTDTIHFENYYAPDYEITIDSIRDNKIIYRKKEIPNNNKDGSSGDEKNRTSRYLLFGGISMAALALLTWIFIRRRNKIQDRSTNG